MGDVCDVDADGDGVNGDGSGGPGADDDDLNENITVDAEGDGIDDVGGTGRNGPDNCVLGAIDDEDITISLTRAVNSNQLNLDGDAFGDNCDNDADGDEFWLGYQNFYVISRYNPRSKYAMAVYQLSLSILSAVSEADIEADSTPAS